MVDKWRKVVYVFAGSWPAELALHPHVQQALDAKSVLQLVAFHDRKLASDNRNPATESSFGIASVDERRNENRRRGFTGWSF